MTTTTQISTITEFLTSSSAGQDVSSTPFEESGFMEATTIKDSSNGGVIFPDLSINLVEPPGTLLPGLKEPASIKKDDPTSRPIDGDRPTEVRPAQPRSEEELTNVIFPDVITGPLGDPDDDNSAGEEQK